MTIEDGICYDGVLHVISNVLIPPKPVGGVMQEWNGEELEVEDLKERLSSIAEDEKEEQPFWKTYL